MSKDENDIVQRFVDNFVEIATDIREVRGINKDKLTDLEKSFDELKVLVSKKRSVPIDAAGIFIDLYSAIESQASLYENEREILEFADYLAVLAKDVCYPS